MNEPKSKNEYGYASPTHRAVHAGVAAAVARLAVPVGFRVRFDAKRPRINASGVVAWVSAVWYGPRDPGAEPWPGVIYAECAREGGLVSVRDAGPRPRIDQGLHPAPVGALLRRSARQYAADLAAAIGVPGIVDPQYEHPWQRKQREAREAREAAQAQMDDFIELLGGEE
jgi:hypothetical protein